MSARDAFPLLLERDGPRCFYCDESPELLAVDHVWPRARGGSDDLSNLVLACHPCNYTKATQPAWLFLLLRIVGGKIDEWASRNPERIAARRAAGEAYLRGDWARELRNRLLQPPLGESVDGYGDVDQFGEKVW